jgi:ubiquinone/menaquinone biosynthesis C-methylase UbiE
MNNLVDVYKMKKLDFTINDVNEIYSGPVGVLWEMLMGEQIHVGGERETQILADKAGITKNDVILDVCSALGGPTRYLAEKYGCTIVGLDATQHMIDESIKRTKTKSFVDLITYKLGNALDMPFKASSFDVVWGQDAWCYITDKDRLINESYRVLRPGGKIAFTDWLQIGNMTIEEWTDLNSFMTFPYMETMDGYTELLDNTGFEILSKEDESTDFAKHCHMYQRKLRDDLKNDIIQKYGKEMFEAADNGLNLWVQAADNGKVGRGRIIAKKI